MTRLFLVLLLAILGCRRTHPPGPGAEPATENAPAPPTENAPAAVPSAQPSADNSAAPPSAPTTTQPSPPPPIALEKRYPMPDGGTLNGDPRGPRPAEVKRILDGALADVQRCFDGDPDIKDGEIPVSVHFFVEPGGYTGAATLKAEAKKETQECARGVYDKLRFPEFHGDKIELAPGFTYWKKALGKDAGAK